MAAPRFDDLAAIIDALESAGRLARVQSEADPRHELGGIAHGLEGGGRAVLFERLRGQRWPVLTGLFADRAILAGLIGCEPAHLARHLAARAENRIGTGLVLTRNSPMLGGSEIDVDLGKIPVPTHAPKDGGACFTAAVLIAKDPETGVRIVQMPQAQTMGRDSLRLNVEAGGAIEIALEKARRLGRSLWVTLNVGASLGLQIAAAMPGAAMGGDALSVAAAIDGAPVSLIPGLESDVEYVANAMWALECEIVPGETGRAGPFATPAGHYAPAAAYPVMHVRRVHRREAPIFQTILPGRELRGLAGLAGEIRLCALLRSQVPGFMDACLTAGSDYFHHAVVQVAAHGAPSAKHAIIAAFAAFPPLKMVTVVDDTVDIRDAAAVEGAVAARFDAASGLVRIEMPESAGGPKLGLDATQPAPKRADQDAIAYKPVALERHAITGAGPKPAAVPAPAPSALAPMRPAPVALTVQEPAASPEPVMSAPDDPTPAPPPPQNADWNENRWLQRELESMRAAQGESATAVPVSIPAEAIAPPAVVDASTAAKKNDDWDEDRWLKRELEAMKRESVAKTAAAIPEATTPSAVAPPAKSTSASRQAPRAAVPAKPEPNVAADADEGGFFGGSA